MTKVFLLLLIPFVSFSAVDQVVKTKDVFYANKQDNSYTLNIYQPKHVTKPLDVVVFVHGGSWSSGDKKTYWWLARNFARKGVVCLVVNYPLAPAVDYKQMALAVAQAFKWTKANVANYGGNPDRIFAMGHSAGAHLIELIDGDPAFFKQVGIENPMKAMILNDPFGLDMYAYLKTAEKDHFYFDFLRSFSADPEVWKKGSPLNYLDNINNPHLIFYGSKTYGAIQLQAPELYHRLTVKNVSVQLDCIKGKKHVGMIAQMIFGHNKLYKSILEFMSSVD